MQKDTIRILGIKPGLYKFKKRKKKKHRRYFQNLCGVKL